LNLRRHAVRIIAAFLALGISASAGDAAPRVFVDDAGRRVEVPEGIARVYAAGGPASVLLYALAPDRLIGWNRALSPAERAFIPKPYADLPAFGRLTGRGNTANVEVVLRTHPDVIIDYGSIRPTYVSLADRVQEQSGIPYILLDGSLAGMPRALRALGALLGARERAEVLARYAESVLADVDHRLRQVPPEARPRVYYARGPNGLETGLKGSINVESLERLGARNVAAEGLGGGSLARVSLEQVLAWDPDLIVTIDAQFAAAVRADPLWKTLRAVREGQVYLAPTDPFPWIDFPPSVNRLIGLRWLGAVLYPRLFSEDLRADTRDFYALFYHRAPADAQIEALLSGLGARRQ
jgi:iron complex transport system substrate-binding protein